MHISPPFTDSERSEVISQIDPLFQNFAKQKHIPGLTFGVLMDGQLVYANGFGLRNIAGQAPATPDSIFRIASMTKSITAMSIIKLRDEGKLRLDEPVADYVPELATLRYPTNDSAPITIRQLLTMSAGFPEDNPWGDRQLAAEDAEFSRWLSGGIPFSNPPGITFEYSNYNYAILGHIVSTVSGIPYSTFATYSILEPLGMTSSTFDIRSVPRDRLAMGYRLEAENWVEEPPLADGSFGPMGGLFTTIPDFARYMAYLLSAFPPRDGPEREPLLRSSLREMQQPWQFGSVTAIRPTPDVPAVILSEGYGYGLACRHDSALGYSVSHGGGLPGYGTFYCILPEHNLGIVAFTNLTYSAPRAPINEALMLIKTAGFLKPRTRVASAVLQTVRNEIIGLYKKWDDATAQALAADSFWLDTPLEKRREQFVQLRADLGACQSSNELQPENALRGRWKMDCERGSFEVFVTLAPTVPPLVQFLQFTVARPLSPDLRKAAVALVRLINTWDVTKFRRLFSPHTKREWMRRQLEAVNSDYGPLKMGDVLESDGKSYGRIRVVGERGSVDIRLELEPRSGRIREISFTCV